MKISGIGIVLSLLLGAASSLSATVTKTTTTISSAQNPSAYGQPVNFTATSRWRLARPDGEERHVPAGDQDIGNGYVERRLRFAGDLHVDRGLEQYQGAVSGRFELWNYTAIAVVSGEQSFDKRW